MSNQRSATTRFAFAIAGLAAVLTWLAAAPAEAQPKKKKDDQAQPADAPPAEGEPQEPTPEQIEATKKFQEGKALADEQRYEEAIAAFEAAFDIYPDPGLQFVIGEAYQLWGNQIVEGDRAAGFEKFRQSKAAYESFLELSPESPIAEQVRERIAQLEESIANEEQRLREEEEARLAEQREAEEAERRAEEERLRKLREKEGMQLALDAMVIAGAEQDLSAVARMMVGGLLGWGRFAFEGHLGVDGFLRVDSDRGVQGNAFALDLGARYGFADRFVGPFVSGGGSFGLFLGRPRERRLSDDPDTCAGFAGNDCAFRIDKSLTGRLGFGYGFEASEKTTVAVRLEAQYWLFSVDGEQDAGSPPAALVEKPQSSIAFMLGLEFMRFK